MEVPNPPRVSKKQPEAHAQHAPSTPPAGAPRSSPKWTAEGEEGLEAGHGWVRSVRRTASGTHAGKTKGATTLMCDPKPTNLEDGGPVRRPLPRTGRAPEVAPHADDVLARDGNGKGGWWGGGGGGCMKGSRRNVARAQRVRVRVRVPVRVCVWGGGHAPGPVPPTGGDWIAFPPPHTSLPLPTPPPNVLGAGAQTRAGAGPACCEACPACTPGRPPEWRCCSTRTACRRPS